MHFPFVHLYACSAVHSAWDVGFDSANINGAGDTVVRNSQIDFVNVCGIALTPMIAVALTARTACSREVILPSLTSNSVPFR
mmetsp:Transcript_3940/g.6138  ORF Transcript_3940/g.6138 Transcript_3940/m.6138 type:complete len:82 (+) Transcript_3940:378-623(+)